MAKQKLYWEDLHVGQKFTSGEYKMDEKRIKEFAAEFDPQPFHLDEAAGEQSIFKGLAASGWHTAAAAMRLLVDSDFDLVGGIVGVGGELNWPRPTRAGDILRVEGEIMEMIPSRSKPMQGIAKVRNTTLNQNNEVVQVFTASIIVYRKKSTFNLTGAQRLRQTHEEVKDEENDVGSFVASGRLLAAGGARELVLEPRLA